ncbi:MAG: hypothetical protein H3C51_02540 [Rubellimicrobium sp.]|nr:hypothetical protein [Rubellimicrobium sp.]
MDAIANIFLAGGALGAAAYCLVLSRRLQRFTDLEKGVGGAVAVLSAQVDDLTRALALAQGRAGESAVSLTGASQRAEAAAGRLEVLLAALHDLPAPAAGDAANDPAGATVFVRGLANGVSR